jgi:hypothetical protein
MYSPLQYTDFLKAWLQNDDKFINHCILQSIEWISAAPETYKSNTLPHSFDEQDRADLNNYILYWLQRLMIGDIALVDHQFGIPAEFALTDLQEVYATGLRIQFDGQLHFAAGGRPLLFCHQLAAEVIDQ